MIETFARHLTPATCDVDHAFISYSDQLQTLSLKFQTVHVRCFANVTQMERIDRLSISGLHLILYPRDKTQHDSNQLGNITTVIEEVSFQIALPGCVIQ